MNIFFGRVFSENTFEFVKEIIEKYRPGNFIGIVEDFDCIDLKEMKKYFNLIYNRLYLERGKFIDEECYLQSTPIDEVFLTKLSCYEWQIYESISRFSSQDNSFRNRKRFYYNSVRFWNSILERYQIELFIGMTLPHTFHELIVYYLCKIKSIKTLLLQRSNLKYIDNYYFFVESVNDSLHELKSIYKNMREQNRNAEDLAALSVNPDFANAIKEYIEEKVDVVPIYMQNEYFKNKILYNLRKNAPWSMRFKITLQIAYQMIFQTVNIEFIHELRRKINTRDFFNEDEAAFHYYNANCTPFVPGEPYIYVPLQAQPEETTLPRAGRYEDQALFIKMISACLPKGYWIYVKEHPSQMLRYKLYPLYRDAQFYKELISLGNVKFISWKEASFGLIESSIAVATANGTPGFEAICRNKPCLMFGSGFYQHAPGVYWIKELQLCKLAIEEILAGENETINKIDLKLYLLSLERISYKSSVFLPTAVRKEEDDELKEAVFIRIKSILQDA